MTSQEKHVYNSFLRISRLKQNSPYRVRKNFDGFEEDKNYILVRKLCKVLHRNSTINLEDFLTAPYEVYNDGNYYDLKFYCTQRAIKVYTTFLKKRLTNIDSDQMIDKIRDSLFYIYKFCVEQNISINKYPSHETKLVKSFILHIQENKIVIYTMFGFSNFEKNLNIMPYDVREFILGEQATNIDGLRRNYLSSNRAKLIIRKGIDQLLALQKKA